MGDMFSIPVAVRGYELDLNGHLNQAVYLQYAEHARWEALRAAGLRSDVLKDAGIGPVVLETTIRYRSELRDGESVDVTVEFAYGSGKTFRVVNLMRKPDGTLAAEVEGVFGLLDQRTRRLVADPAGTLRRLATDPTALSLV